MKKIENNGIFAENSIKVDKNIYTLYTKETVDTILNYQTNYNRINIADTLDKIAEKQPLLISKDRSLSQKLASALTLPYSIIDNLDDLEPREKNNSPTYKYFGKLYADSTVILKGILNDGFEYSQPHIQIATLLLGMQYNPQEHIGSFYSPKKIGREIIKAIEDNTIDFVCNAEGIFENIETKLDFDSKEISTLLHLLNSEGIFNKQDIQNKHISGSELKNLFFKKYEEEKYKEVLKNLKKIEDSVEYIAFMKSYTEGDLMTKDGNHTIETRIPGRHHRNILSEKW